MRTELGKIQAVHFGFGGYQDVQFGISFELGGKGWGVCDFWGHWAQRSEHARWSEEQWKAYVFETWRRIAELCESAKVKSVEQLHGIPVEVSFDGMKLESWRVLTEVL